MYVCGTGWVTELVDVGSSAHMQGVGNVHQSTHPLPRLCAPTRHVETSHTPDWQLYNAQGKIGYSLQYSKNKTQRRL